MPAIRVTDLQTVYDVFQLSHRCPCSGTGSNAGLCVTSGCHVSLVSPSQGHVLKVVLFFVFSIHDFGRIQVNYLVACRSSPIPSYLSSDDTFFAKNVIKVMLCPSYGIILGSECSPHVPLLAMLNLIIG